MRAVEYREFHVGDHVRVVDFPNCDCPFSWIRSMNEYCSREAEITRKEFNNIHGTYMYCIDIDRFSHAWCGNCFVPPDSDLEIEVASGDELLEFLM